MIEDINGNLIESDAEALVNTVNTVGVMGKGVALQFKQAFPANYEAYQRACARGEVVIGRMFVHETSSVGNPRLIINFPTKRHWRARSRLADIEAGLVDLRRVLVEQGVESVAIPALGCGNGGLRWSDVRPRIIEALRDLSNVRIALFGAGHGPSAAAMRVATPLPEDDRRSRRSRWSP